MSPLVTAFGCFVGAFLVALCLLSVKAAGANRASRRYEYDDPIEDEDGRDVA